MATNDRIKIFVDMVLIESIMASVSELTIRALMAEEENAILSGGAVDPADEWLEEAMGK
jgi:hypothetical protein